MSFEFVYFLFCIKNMKGRVRCLILSWSPGEPNVQLFSRLLWDEMRRDKTEFYTTLSAAIYSVSNLSTTNTNCLTRSAQVPVPQVIHPINILSLSHYSIHFVTYQIPNLYLNMISELVTTAASAGSQSATVGALIPPMSTGSAPVTFGHLLT